MINPCSIILRRMTKLKIYAYGAAAKGISFLNFCHKHADRISGVFDKNKMKQDQSK